jgi:predicted MFS family arabinose efflux permease
MNGVWLSLAVTMAIQTLVSLVVFAPPVLAPVAEPEVGVPASAIGILTALIYSSAAFAALRSGSTIGRYGPMRTSQISLLLCAVGIALFATANVTLVALGALVIGLGYGVVTPSSSAILAERVPPNLRAFIFSLKQTGVPIGGALAGALLPALMLAFGWKVAALATSGLCLGLTVAVQPWRRAVDAGSRMPDAEPVGLVEPLRKVLADRRLREMALASFAYSGMQMCLGSFLVVFLHERAGLSVAAAGAALSVAMAAGIAGRVLWGVAADNWIKPRLLLGALGVAMSLAAFAVATVSANWPLLPVLVVSLAYGATAVGWNGVYLSEVARTAPAGQAAAATGASLALTYCGVVTLPLLFWAIVAGTGSYAAAFVVTGCLTLWRGAVLLRG